MSLLSNRSLQIHIGASSVRGTLRAKRPHHKVLGSSCHEFHGADHGPTGAAPLSTIDKPCIAAMDAVLHELRANAAPRKPDLRVVISDAGVHFDVVQGDYGGSNERHLQSIAVACIAEILGEATSRQVVRWQLQPDLQHLLISCIDLREVTAVTETAIRHGLRLQSLQPEFCFQWNRYASVLPAKDCVFATINDGYATVAYAKGGTIAALSSGPCFLGEDPLHGGKHETQSIDQRTDRLLASLGQDASVISNFILVTAAPECIHSVSRWRAFGLSEEQR